jgi:hypothetical protein
MGNAIQVVKKDACEASAQADLFAPGADEAAVESGRGIFFIEFCPQGLQKGEEYLISTYLMATVN